MGCKRLFKLASSVKYTAFGGAVGYALNLGYLAQGKTLDEVQVRCHPQFRGKLSEGLRDRSSLTLGFRSYVSSIIELSHSAALTQGLADVIGPAPVQHRKGVRAKSLWILEA